VLPKKPCYINSETKLNMYKLTRFLLISARWIIYLESLRIMMTMKSRFHR